VLASPKAVCAPSSSAQERFGACVTESLAFGERLAPNLSCHRISRDERCTDASDTRVAESNTVTESDRVIAEGEAPHLSSRQRRERSGDASLARRDEKRRETRRACRAPKAQERFGARLSAKELGATKVTREMRRVSRRVCC